MSQDFKKHMYNKGQNNFLREFYMCIEKDSDKKPEAFGKRLARLRKLAGYSQRDLAKAIGISHRVVAYYEKETTHPPGTLLPALAKALNVSADALLGMEQVELIDQKQKDAKLWNKFKQLEKLPDSERRQLIKLIDKFLELDSLKNENVQETT